MKSRLILLLHGNAIQGMKHLRNFVHLEGFRALRHSLLKTSVDVARQSEHIFSGKSQTVTE